MAQHTADAIWNGNLKDGKGNINTGNGALYSPYSFKTRFEGDKKGTTPEELIGAAHAACFSMFLSSVLQMAGFTAKHIRTEATVHLDLKENGPQISKIELVSDAEVPGLNEAEFQQFVQKAKENCPVSQALKAVPEIKLIATLS